MYTITGESFYDGKGTLVSAGGIYRDYRGCLCTPGVDAFYDSKGCLTKPGDSFYDAKGCLTRQGESFYDTSGRIVHWYDE